MISKLFCLLVLLSLQMQGREASFAPVVETLPEITVTFGTEGLLECAYEHKSFAVYWRFMSDSSSSDLLVVLDQYYQVGERSGPGYDKGRYNITNDYSLIIHDVSVEDEGRYICEVSDFETGQVFRNYTNVTVTVEAVRPFVRVNDCGSDIRVSVNVTDNPKASCMIQITPNQRHVQLDCFVEGAKPQVDMSWFDNTTLQDLSNGSSLVLTNGKREGTVDQKLTVILKASEFQSKQEYYFTCTAEGQAVGGIAYVTVGVNKVPSGVSAGISVVVGLVVLVVLMLVIAIPVLLWKKYKRPQRRKDGDLPMGCESALLNTDKRQSLLEKRKKIMDFSPNTSTTMNKDTNHIKVGVFGLGKAGKSSLINSLIFSLTGKYPGEADKGATTHSEGDITGQKEEIKLTDHIHLLNFKGMVECDPTKRKEIFSQIEGQPINDIPNVPVHCAIFICDYKKLKGRYEEFMKLLAKDVSSYFGRGIMLGIPNKGGLDDGDDKIKRELADTIGIPENHVWIFKNYTLESHEEDVERSIELLDFILHCLTVAKENKQFQDSQKETKQIPSTQTEHQQIQNIKTENQQIPSTQTDNQQIQNIKTENQEIPSTHTENQQIQNIQTENQQIPSTHTENQQIQNILTKNQQIPSAHTENPQIPSTHTENQHNPNIHNKTQRNPNSQTEAWPCKIF